MAMLHRTAIALSLALALGCASSAWAANTHPLHHQARVIHRHVAPAYTYDRYGPYDRYGAYNSYGAYNRYDAYGAYARGSGPYNAYAADTLPRGEPTYMGVQDQFLRQTGSE
jgi:hypothetical protein